MPRLLTLGAALTVAALGAVAVVPDAALAAKPIRTHYSLHASGWGTKIVGGDLPISSGTTGYAVLSCTNRAGLSRSNSVASVDVPGGLATVKGVSTKVFTKKVGNRVSSWSVHKVASVVLAQSALGSLSITGVKSVAHAYHDKTGFHAETESTLAAISATIAGVTHTFKIPSPGRELYIPILDITIGIGAGENWTTAHKAHAVVSGIKLEVGLTKTVVRIATARATMSDGIVSGLFHGSANGANASALSDIVGVGPQVKLPMPCAGTDGKVRKASAVGVDIAGLLDVGAVSSEEKGQQNKRRAWGYTQGSVASVNIGGGALVLNAIKGRVAVAYDKKKHKYTVSDAGTTVGSISVSGKTYSLPELNGLEIPGVLKVATNVFTKYKNGGSVTAVQIKLLNGTGAVVNLGNANLRISKP